jgi:hypothetical protein
MRASRSVRRTHSPTQPFRPCETLNLNPLLIRQQRLESLVHNVSMSCPPCEQGPGSAVFSPAYWQTGPALVASVPLSEPKSSCPGNAYRSDAGTQFGALGEYTNRHRKFDPTGE